MTYTSRMEKVLCISGHVGDYDVFATKDGVIVMAGKDIIVRHKYNYPPGRDWDPRRITLGHTEDFTIIGLWDVDGFGYAINLECPDFSEWGYGA